MTKEIKNVALAGASGSLGSHILQALNKNGRFNVTVLARKTTKDMPTGTRVKVDNFESVPDLTAALKGQDALVDATSVPDPSFAIRLMDAAAAAGVYRMIPSEFSSDPLNAKTRGLPSDQGKAKALEHIQTLSDDKGITWTAISTHGFLDWGLRMAFIGIDLQNKSIDYFKPGLAVLPLTTLESIGTAVTNTLTKAEATENRICYICNTQMTQRDLAELVKGALGHEGWKIKDLQAGEVNMQVIGGIVRFSISTPGYIQKLEKTDNDIFGVKEMSDAEIQDLVREIAQEKSAA